MRHYCVIFVVTITFTRSLTLTARLRNGRMGTDLNEDPNTGIRNDVESVFANTVS